MRRAGYVGGVFLTAGLILLGAYVSSPGSKNVAVGQPSITTSTGTHITISNFAFSPMALTVSPGATISVTNRDSATHTLTATNGQFSTGDVTQDQTKTFRAPTGAGTYHYICSIHQYMMGSITVN